jgi:hypothetical protein
VIPPDCTDDPGVDFDFPDPRDYDAVLVPGARTAPARRSEQRGSLPWWHCATRQAGHAWITCSAIVEFAHQRGLLGLVDGQTVLDLHRDPRAKVAAPPLR